MDRGVSRRVFLGGLLSGVASGAFANDFGSPTIPKPHPISFKQSQAASLDQIVRSAGLSGDIGFAVADAKTGRILESRNPNAELPPASVSKAITAAYALAVLGPGYRFKTRVITKGSIQGGVLKGDLYLVGGGDPVLNTDDLADMAASVKKRGIRRVQGKFHVVGTALPFVYSIDRDQAAHHGYNATISGMNVNFNRVHFEWKRAGQSYTTIMGAPAERFKPAVSVSRMEIVDRKRPVYTYNRDQKSERWTVSRTALGGGGARWLPVRNPEIYAGDIFRAVAKELGVYLPRATIRKTVSGGTVIAENRSPSMASLCRGMLKYSTNLTAESLGMMATKTRNGSVNSLRASAREMSDWAKQTYGINADFVDHSGLGDASRISAREMVKAFVKLHHGPLASLMKNIPMRDANYKIVKNHPVNVQAKTGTLNFVSSLGGYLSTPDGTELAFAIFTADMPKRRQARSSGQDRPQGSRGWNRKSRHLQQRLMQRWGAVYGT
ncbi:D-alanyl-D-alanine carboxypeptidase/D-alanyl-D-alanine-endopeptidase [Pseudaestuariivita rosea]|uniref:D-alanyl-D-alanine carboxypeptidase/D-alanyl-D-alanine endopeptidase n=1 Tax=Pseudaestuariivita rosea TaxID=2763263 RepID=UPI001ABA42F3|nr:D-alanyl-D-alanine carboxypeptidase/D-alanyl-D-alanine-endopeptidase [Pseudaestuariivita rosea]